ncbi:glycosyl hydrolase [Crassaminicella thermophila]|uniref:Glycosyl hydrolase n=1 Tax=Crassaminicella thermophila TaxID=2599308 RepID=A0A5C0SEG6_CRATE|nr:glycosyl hydrolase family 18 protein [Crassaminicella thermophila]QEK11369.1 glycosyl hydrolase [Crassaminicella thermophila]
MKKNDFYIILGCLMLLIGFIFTKHYALAAPIENNEVIIKDGEQMIIYEDYDEIVKIENNNVYIDLYTLSKHLNLLVDYDENNKIAVIASSNKIIRFYQNKKVKINQKITMNISPMVFVNERPFVPINQIAEHLNIKYNFIEEKKLLLLENQYEKIITAKAAKDNVNVRFKPTSWSLEDDLLKENEKVEILKKEGKWIKILTPRGKIGYVKEYELKDEEEILGVVRENKPIWKPEKGKIMLTWEHVHKSNPDTSIIGELKGLNVISPTWITLTDASGKINHKISKDYIDWAKNRGYKIWPVFTNNFDPKLTNEFFKNPSAREKAIDEVLKLVKENYLDGINIDFENVYLKDKEKLVLFVRELTSAFHENGLIVSIDVTVKGGSENWSQCYDRAALGEVVDYVVLMAYDEHWGSSPISGSVASMGWVEKGINGLLEEVSPQKLILGVPFYTRIWMEKPSVKNPDKIEVKSKAAGMETINEILKINDIVKVWDEKSGQNYVEYNENDLVYKIWIEDGQSMKLRADFVNKYNLAGIGAWRRGFETEDMWNIINETLRERP